MMPVLSMEIYLKRTKTIKNTISVMIALGLLTVVNAPLLAFDLSYASYPMPFCSKTTKAALHACQYEIKDDYWVAIGNCHNLTNADARKACASSARETRYENHQLCKEQADARNDICRVIGQAPYDPVINASNFVDPADIGKGISPNPYFPLVEGTTWLYKNDSETITVMVTKKFKEILGVNCVVVRDIVEEEGEVIEDTEDWYAQDTAGNVWYFGEISKNFEDGELVDLEGSWKAGVDGAKAGYLMKAVPRVGEMYRQEFFLAEAEDMAEVVSVTGTESVPVASCHNDCLVTHDFSPLEPDVNEHKYYAPGIGMILEVDVETGGRVELVELIMP